MTMKTLEVWVAVDADGNYEAGDSEESACERFDDFDPGRAGVTGYRLVKVLLTVPLPGPMTATAVLAEDAPPVATVSN